MPTHQYRAQGREKVLINITGEEMIDEKFNALIERGKQVGSSFSFPRGGETFWITLAVQKVGAEYFAHIALIKEKNMDREKFELYETWAFPTLEKAIDYLQMHSPSPFAITSLSTFKGQKGFNPKAEDILREVP
ncbi:hypothetical protein [Pseudoduganella sp. R-34]|uniref:hypothetical protein n=1 Tax=unclassified Pseudoduganella TaxID=2637179 RepID=UPI003CFB9966